MRPLDVNSQEISSGKSFIATNTLAPVRRSMIFQHMSQQSLSTFQTLSTFLALEQFLVQMQTKVRVEKTVCGPQSEVTTDLVAFEFFSVFGLDVTFQDVKRLTVPFANFAHEYSHVSHHLLQSPLLVVARHSPARTVHEIVH